MTDSKPMQGLAAYLRAEARSCVIGKDNRETLLGWAEDVEAALAAPQPEPMVIEQVAEAARKHGLTLVKTAEGLEFMKLGAATAWTLAEPQPAKDLSLAAIGHTPVINYEPLYDFAMHNRISYNELCNIVRKALE